MSNEKDSYDEIIDVSTLPTLSEVKYKKKIDIYKKFNSTNVIPKNGVVLFLGTTGSSYKYDSIVQITALKYKNFEQIDFIDIDATIDLKEALQNFLEFLEDNPIVWHSNFKRNFIGKALKDNNFDMIQNEFFTTITKSKELLFAIPYYGLYHLADYFEIPVDYNEQPNTKEINTCFKLLLKLHKLELEIYS